MSGMGGQASYMSGFWLMVDCYFHPCHLNSVFFKLPEVKTLDDCGFMITQGDLMACSTSKNCFLFHGEMSACLINFSKLLERNGKPYI